MRFSENFSLGALCLPVSDENDDYDDNVDASESGVERRQCFPYNFIPLMISIRSGVTLCCMLHLSKVKGKARSEGTYFM